MPRQAALKTSNIPLLSAHQVRLLEIRMIRTEAHWARKVVLPKHTEDLGNITKVSKYFELSVFVDVLAHERAAP